MLVAKEGTSLFVRNIVKFNINKGTFVTTHINKPVKTGIEKFACALVSLAVFDGLVSGETTILRFDDGEISYEAHSDKGMSYESLIALSYALRINNYKITDIAIASYTEKDSLIAVENIGRSQGGLRVSLPESNTEDINDIILMSNELAKSMEYSIIKFLLNPKEAVETVAEKAVITSGTKSTLAEIHYENSKKLFKLLEDTVSSLYSSYETYILEIETPESAVVKKSRKETDKIYIVETPDGAMILIGNQIVGIYSKKRANNLSYIVGTIQHNNTEYSLDIIDNVSILY